MTTLSFFAGIITTTTLVALIASVSSSDQASATAVLYLFRSLGAVVGLSISSAVIQQILRITLTKRFSGSPYDVEELVRRVRESLTYIDSLDPAVQVIVRQSYSQALFGAFSYGTLLSLLSLVSSLFIRDRSLDTSN
ncbi:hypothetical protein Clacol_004302 [Clathrus columnatus]|uniref:Gustatory receptor n=1 Tax=Clathrus columnatus TaxID=1419009 RepID=A0AAV5AAN2_9AGAM|nr:hypothetical protein Clacol_004302 [Clathrus columnatus]